MTPGAPLRVDPPISDGGSAAVPRYARPCCPSSRVLLRDRLGRIASLQRRARQLMAVLERDGVLPPPGDWRKDVYGR